MDDDDGCDATNENTRTDDDDDACDATAID